MNLIFTSLFILSLCMLGLSGCGGQSTASKSSNITAAEATLLPPSENTIKASSLQKVLFDYTASTNSVDVQSAIASLELPDQSKTIMGNLTVALDVIDANGIEQVLLDFSNGNSIIPALQICGGTALSCTNSTFNIDQSDNTEYRVFINGINPHDYRWKNGTNIINVWVDNSQGQRSIATTFNLNWQAVVVAQTQAELTDVVINPTTGDKTGNLAISWSEVPEYLFYNVFIATEPGINSDTFTNLVDGQARLSLVNNSVVIEGLDATKEYFFTVSGVDDGGESAFSREKSVIDLSSGAPIVRDDNAQLDENSSLIINVIENDSDDSSIASLVISQVTNGANGQVSINDDGSVAYVHDGSQTTSDQFTYKINDGEFDSATAIVTISITLVNDAPIAQNDAMSVSEGSSVIIDLRRNDSDEETVNSELIITNLSTASNGTLVNNNDGTVTYFHDGSETLSDSFTYTIYDGELDSAPATVSLIINGVNDVPIAVNDLVSVDEGNSVVIDLRSNDSDAETANSELIITNLSTARNGTLVNNTDGTVTYNHDGSETLSDSFTYTINDGELESAPATASLVINAVNDSPLATDDLASVDEGSSVIIDLRSNDSDAETANSELIITNLSTASNGTLVNNTDGTVTYINDGSETLSDSFIYTINDGEVDSLPATASLMINAVNDSPLATDDLASVDEGSSVVINLRSNDSDAETANSELIITNLSIASNGTLVNNNDGTVTYFHDGSETLSDSFTYTINDGEEDSTPATASLVINAVNDVPIAIDDLASVDEGNSVIIDLRTNDSDAETANSELIITNLSTASNGTLVNNTDGTVTYSHDGSETLSDRFTYTINDGELDSLFATVALVINSVNDAPTLTAAPTSVVIAENASVNDPISTVTAIDPEDDAQIWEISAGNTDGIFGIDTSGNVTIVDISELNYEVTSQYTLTVSATDSIDSAIFETIDISIDVSDVIENQVLVLDALFGVNGETSFNTYSFQYDDEIVSTLRQSDGKLILVVNIFRLRNNDLSNIATIRMNTDGSVDTSYGDNGRRTFEMSGAQSAENAVLDPADNLYIVGDEYDIDTIVLKIDSSGNLDTSFGIDGKFEYSSQNSGSRVLGQDILLHSMGDIYVAADVTNPILGRRDLTLIRIDSAGDLLSLNDDGGANEFILFGSNDFFTVGLDEISTGELVVFGTDRPLLQSSSSENYGVAVFVPTDFSQPIIISESFDVAQVLTGSGSTAEFVEDYLRVDNNSFLIAGSSNYPNGDVEATIMKINVTNSVITVDSTFATSGVFIADVDGDTRFASSILNVDLDSSGNITFVADSIIDDDIVYFIDQLTSAGEFNVGFTPQHYIAGFPLLVASDLIVNRSNDNVYLAYDTRQSLDDNIVFKQFLNDGSEVVASSHELNFSSSDELLRDINLLSMAPNTSDLWVNTHKQVDSNVYAGSLSLISGDGQLDHRLNNGNNTLIDTDVFYGPSLELADGSLIYTTYDSIENILTIYKVIDTNLTADENFVPGLGYIEVLFQIFEVPDVEVNDIGYDAANDHIIIVGTTSEEEIRGFIVKVDATTGDAYTGGEFSDGLLLLSVNALQTLDRVIPQSDGTLVCYGSKVVTQSNQCSECNQSIQPYLMKILPGGALDRSFNSTGIKTYDLGMAFQDFEAVDVVQLADNSVIFSVNNISSSTSHLVKTDVSGNLISEFANSGVVDLVFGETATVVNDIVLDDSDNIYAVGHATNADDDSLIVKISSVDGSFDSVFNGNSTPGYWMFDEGGSESLLKVLFNPFSDHIILGDTTTGPTGDRDIRVRAYNLIQNDN